MAHITFKLFVSSRGTPLGLDANRGWEMVDGLIRRKGLKVEILDTSRLSEEELWEAYLEAVKPSVARRFRIRQIFGSKRLSGWLFGRGVPALLVLNEDMPMDVYPHEAGGRVVTISDFLRKEPMVGCPCCGKTNLATLPTVGEGQPYPVLFCEHHIWGPFGDLVFDFLKYEAGHPVFKRQGIEVLSIPQEQIEAHRQELEAAIKAHLRSVDGWYFGDAKAREEACQAVAPILAKTNTFRQSALEAAARMDEARRRLGPIGVNVVELINQGRQR